MRYVLLGVIVFSFAVLSLSLEGRQANPCDTLAAPGTITVATAATPFTVGVCQKSVDTNGTATTITTLVVQIDGTEVYRGLPTTGVVGPNAAGQVYYPIPKSLTASIGNHTVTAAAVNAAGQGAGISRPFVLKLADTVPVAPSGIGVTAP